MVKIEKLKDKDFDNNYCTVAQSLCLCKDFIEKNETCICACGCYKKTIS